MTEAYIQKQQDKSTAWTDSDLDGMKIGIGSGDCANKGQLVQAYIKVIYTEATG